MKSCELDGLVAICTNLNKESIISVYNPNIEPLKGFFVRVESNRANIVIKVPKDGISGDKMMAEEHLREVSGPGQVFCKKTYNDDVGDR